MDLSVAKNFTRAADYYNEHANFQRKLATKFISLVSPPEDCNKILDIGSGTGFTIIELLKRFPDSSITAVDISEGMLNVAKRNIESDKVKWVVGDARKVQFEPPYDLIVSNASLHWMRPYPTLFTRLKTILHPNGKLAFTLMLDGTFKELHEIRNEVAPDKKPSTGLPTISDLDYALAESGLRVEQSNTLEQKEYYPSAKVFIDHIRKLGITGGSVSRGNQRLTSQELEEVIRIYNNTYTNDEGQIVVTYSVGYLEVVA